MDARIPLTLGFGFYLGLGFYEIGSPQSENKFAAAKLAGLFNLGIQLFDRACDRSAECLHDAFTESTLIDLIDDPAANLDLASSAANITDPPLRVLIEVLCAWFRDLHQFARQRYGTQPWQNLRSLLLQAYRSQVRTIAGVCQDTEALLRLSAAKSTLPFLIMSRLTQLIELYPGNNAGNLAVVEATVGNIFWQVDELMDLTADMRSGEINSIVLKLGRSAHVTGEIQAAIHVLCSELDELLTTLQAMSPCLIDTFPFGDIILAFVRSWATAK